MANHAISVQRVGCAGRHGGGDSTFIVVEPNPNPLFVFDDKKRAHSWVNPLAAFLLLLLYHLSCVGIPQSQFLCAHILAIAIHIARFFVAISAWHCRYAGAVGDRGPRAAGVVGALGGAAARGRWPLGGGHAWSVWDHFFFNVNLS